MRILVTGGAGRLGITACNVLQEKGFRVKVFARPSPRNRRNVRKLGERAEVCWGDITAAASVLQALDGVDAVIHMAGILPPVTETNPNLANEVNVGGTRNLVDTIKATGKQIPFVYVSSVAVFGPTPEAEEPISVERNAPAPGNVYGRTKLKAETLIRESGIEYIILRLSASPYTVLHASDRKWFYEIPLNNRVEICHPDEASLALAHAVIHFETAKGNTLIISGGSKERMLYRDMICGILGVLGLPLPPSGKFRRQPYSLDYYDTSQSQLLLQYQHKIFDDYLGDVRKTLARRFTPAFLLFMRYFIGPVFGKLIMRLI